jgi:hypothetical protein
MQTGEGGGFIGGFGQSGPGGIDPNTGRPGMPRPNSPMFSFRNFGPGVIVGGQSLANLPNNVSVNIQKQNGKPTHITVQRGDDKWEITGDDPEALKKLPEDLRPAVEGMLHGGGGGFGGAMFGSGNGLMPNFPPQGPGAGPSPGMDTNRMFEQLQRMEKQLNEMQRRMHGQDNAQADKPNDQEESK